MFAVKVAIQRHCDGVLLEKSQMIIPPSWLIENTMYTMEKQVNYNFIYFLISDEPHGPLVLTIEPYQDQASGCPVTELDGKVAWVGTLQVHTPEV